MEKEVRLKGGLLERERESSPSTGQTAFREMQGIVGVPILPTYVPAHIL